MRKIFLIGLTLFLFAGTNHAQITATLPEIIPPSPEAAAFMKAGLGNVNFSNGAITTRISLYDMKVHDYTLPLSLSYSSQGMKVDEASSRVGMGWSLQAGGMITRTVRGKPDELAIANPGLPTHFLDDNGTNYTYFSNAAGAASGHDTQRDEYFFSFNGYSGKYVINDNNQAVCLSNENLKIALGSGLHEVTITTPDGVKYYFGQNDAFEKSLHFSMSGNQMYKANIKTAFFLTKIELVNGESITFHYNPINITVNTGISQTLTMGNSGGDQPCTGCGTTEQSTSTKINTIQYATKYLSNIYSTTGEAISFLYEQRPDASGDNRLKTIQITGSAQSVVKYKLDYYDRSDGTNSGAANIQAVIGRFFLTRLSKSGLPSDEVDTSPTAHWQQHQFRYHDMQNAALPITLQQDHYGFYNGFATTLLPIVGPDNSVNFSHRSPSTEMAKKGVLSAIVYPTGGVEEFFYGGNTIPSTVKRNTTHDVSVAGTDAGTPGTASSKTFQTQPMTYAFRVKRRPGGSRFYPVF